VRAPAPQQRSNSAFKRPRGPLRTVARIVFARIALALVVAAHDKDTSRYRVFPIVTPSGVGIGVGAEF